VQFPEAKNLLYNIFHCAEISNQDIAAQAFIFFFAGYETVATLLSFLAHELAENPEIQDKVRQEIDQTISDEGLSYESVMGMKYLEMVVSGILQTSLSYLRRFISSAIQNAF
jgi:cytochrome P450 family 9